MIKIRTKKPVIYSGQRLSVKTGILEFQIKPIIGVNTLTNCYVLSIDTFLVEKSNIEEQDYSDLNQSGTPKAKMVERENLSKIDYHVKGGEFNEDQVNELATGLVASGLVDGLINKPVQYNKALVAHASVISIAQDTQDIQDLDLEIIST